MDRKVINRRYRLERKLGDGATAEVFLGFDTVLSRLVALKLLRPQFASDRTYRLRLEREAQQAARLSHPNIVAIYDVGEDQGIPFIVMEYVDGQSLSEIVAMEAPFHPDDVAILTEQVAAALDFAHQRGLVHRDVKPGNVLVDRQGVAKVTDFGIAKGMAETPLTDKGLAVGTVHYISPEQASGLMATPESDIYSLAVIAFEMLTGELPFESENAVGIAMRHLNESPPDPRDINPDIPRKMSDIVLRALAKSPGRRFHTAGEFANAMTTWRDYHPEDWKAARERATDAAGVRITQTFEALNQAATEPVAYAPVSPPPPLPSPPDASPTATASVSVAAPPTNPKVEEPESSFPWAALILGAGLLAATLWFGRPAWDRLIGGDATPMPASTAVATAMPTIVAVAPTLAPTPTLSPSSTPISLPSLTGITSSAAIGTASALGIEADIVATQPSDTVPDDHVIDQDPSAGTALGSDTQLELVVSSGPAEIAITELAPVGSDGDTAETALRQAGLNVIRADIGSSTIPVGNVAAVDPNSGLVSGDTVTLSISVGDKVQVPFELQGEPLAQVQDALSDLGFEATATISVSRDILEDAGIDLEASEIVNGDVVGVQGNEAEFGAWLAPGTELTVVYYDAELDA